MTFGEMMKALMTERGISLRQLAQITHYDKGHLSKISNDLRPPSEQLAEVLDDALGAGGELAGLRAGPVLGGLSPDDAERLAQATSEPRRVDAEVVRLFESIYDAYGRVIIRPKDLISAVTPTMALIDAFRRDARAPARGKLHGLASRYAQLIARMHYEAGDLERANAWSDRALLAAHEAGDEVLVGFTLARRASHAAAVGDARQTLDLAVAARGRTDMPAHLDSMARRHEAQGHTMTGETDMVRRRLDEAADLLVNGRRGEDTPYASGFSLGFHDIQAAGCMIELGRGDEAIPILERELPGLRRNYIQAFNMARLAHAYADVGDSEKAAEVGSRALALARETGGVRAVQELQHIRGDGSRWWD